MAVLCPSCDREPDPTEGAGSPCPCGGTLIAVVEPVDPVIGKLIDNRFEVTARIGAGAMGTVYCAVQKSIGREVALKLIHSRFAGDVASVKRFFREAQVASRLAHPTTVGVIEFGQDGDGTLYLAMELIRGRTLHDVLAADGALPLPRLIRIGTQLCDALEAAHALAIVHRDLKLENVMVLDGGRDLIKVLDFGLARALGDPALHQTTVGLVSGSPRYMAPELGLSAAAPAPCHDMYSLGVCLAELATGGLLWTSPTLEGLFAAKLDPADALEGVPLLLRPLVGSLLDPDGARRPSAPEVRAALLAFEAGAAALPAPSAPPAAQLATEPTLPVIANAPSLSLELDHPDAPEPDAIVRGLDKLELVAIDGSLPDPPKPAAPPPPPVDPDAAGVKLELDPSWVARRVSQSRAPYQPPPQAPLPKRESNSAGWVLVGLLLIAAGGGAIYYFNTQAKPSADTPAPNLR